MAKTKDFGSVIEKYCSTPKGRRAMGQEHAVSMLAGVLYDACEHLTPAQLHEATGCGMRLARDILDGPDEISLRKAADILAVMGKQLTITAEPFTIGQRPKKKRARKR